MKKFDCDYCGDTGWISSEPCENCQITTTETTSQELRVKVAELCGWKRQPFNPDYGYRWVKEGVWTDWSNREPSPMPDYCNDLNACAEFEKILDRGQRAEYVTALWETTGAKATIELILATAEQRCRAFVETMEASVPSSDADSVGQPSRSDPASSNPKTSVEPKPFSGGETNNYGIPRAIYTIGRSDTEGTSCWTLCKSTPSEGRKPA